MERGVESWTDSWQRDCSSMSMVESSGGYVGPCGTMDQAAEVWCGQTARSPEPWMLLNAGLLSTSLRWWQDGQADLSSNILSPWPSTSIRDIMLEASVRPGWSRQVTVTWSSGSQGLGEPRLAGVCVLCWQAMDCLLGEAFKVSETSVARHGPDCIKDVLWCKILVHGGSTRPQDYRYRGSHLPATFPEPNWKPHLLQNKILPCWKGPWPISAFSGQMFCSVRKNSTDHHLETEGKDLESLSWPSPIFLSLPLMTKGSEGNEIVWNDMAN